MKQFNLQEYLAHPERKVVTRDGRKVTRFLCTDAKTDFPIIALIEATPGSTNEILCAFKKDGRYFDGISSNCDLFFAPTTHEGWIIINKWPNGVTDTDGIIYDTELDIPDILPIGGKRIATIKIEWEE